MLDEDETSQEDLHGGASPWGSLFRRPGSRESADGPRRDRRCDVAVVGAGITGSLIAAHLTGRGHSVVIIDREWPGFGSTAASTAMLQWEIDAPLLELAGYYGMEKAVRCYRSSFQAVQGLAAKVETLGLSCDLIRRHTLYIAAGEVGAGMLKAEHEARRAAGLPGVYLEHRDLLSRYGIDREAAILSPGSAEADPVRLAHGMLQHALDGGASFVSGEAEAYDCASRSAAVLLEGGTTIEAKHVILATGYVMPDFVRSELHSTASSWALATVPQSLDKLWQDRSLIWEASESYSYLRTTADGRVVIGGEDDDAIVDPDKRDALIPSKTETLLGILERLQPQLRPDAEFAWAGIFGETSDGLPLIGPVEGQKGMLAAYGYGNGITFSFLAAEMLTEMVEGRYTKTFDDFAILRPDPTGRN